MYSSLSMGLGVITFVITSAAVLWIVVLKRELFDPRVYVLYGLIHWVLVSQLLTLFGYEAFELILVFPERLYIISSLSILSAVVTFLLGYSIGPIPLTYKPQYGFTSLYKVKFSNLILFSISLGFIGGVSLFLYIKGLVVLPSEFLLPLTNLLIPGSVLATYLIFVYTPKLGSHKRWFLRAILGAIVLFPIFTSNIAVIFPLFSILYWYLNRGVPVRKAPFGIVLLLGVMYPIAPFMNVFIKVLQIPEGIGTPLSLERLLSEYTYEAATQRFITLDVFNMENYSVILSAIELYTDQGNYLMGKSLLVLIPILRFVWPDLVRGFGRTIAIELYGPSNVSVNLAYAVPPVGELIANFGYLSVPIAYFLLGMVCRHMYALFLRCRSQSYLVFYSVLLPWLFLQQRGDILNGNVYAIYISLIILITFLLSRRQKNLKPALSRVSI